MRIGQPTVSAPPIFQATDRKFRSVVRYSNGNVSGIFGDVVDTERNCHTFCIAREMMLRLYWFSAPAFSITSKISYELLLFCIDANDGKSVAKILSLGGGDVIELFVPVRMLCSGVLFQLARNE